MCAEAVFESTAACATMSVFKIFVLQAAAARAAAMKDHGSFSSLDTSAGRACKYLFDGQVRELDRPGNNAADEAADFGRRRVGPAVIDARRNLSGVCGWCPVVLSLHRFFIATSGAVVNHDGNEGTLLLTPLVWSAKRCRLVHAVRDLAMLPGPPAIWLGEWICVPASVIGTGDITQWPCTPGLLVMGRLFRILALASWRSGSWGWRCFLC